jgi:hypothetical protein
VESVKSTAVTSEEFSFVEYGPFDVVPRYTLYPLTADGLAVQDNATERGVTATPVPESAIAAGEFVALLVMLTLPLTNPAVPGAN